MKLNKRLFGYTWLGWLNILLLQWFFVRLQATMDEHTLVIEKLEFIGPVVPCTGWFSNYIWLGNRVKK